MPKKKITSAKLRQPNGHFSQATTIEAQGRLVFLSGMTSRRADGSLPASATSRSRPGRSAKI